MRMLIVTQTVDSEDPILGFFHRWIEEFAKHTERVEVVCLKEGKHHLSANVRVHSLGKIESSKRSLPPAFVGSRQKTVGSTILNRIQYSSRFIVLIWKLRYEYDAVFVHMNPEYVVLGGLFWRAWGKRIVLWYTHKSVNLKLRIAALLANAILTASKESFRLKSSKVRVMGHGIDTDFFSPDANAVRGDWLLSVGRLMPSKRHDLAIRAAALSGRELRIIGDGPERKNLEDLARSLGARVRFLGGLTQAHLRDEYRRAAFLVHTSETGSLDKVVLEALATDLPVITTSGAYADFPVRAAAATPEALAEAVGRGSGNEARAGIIRERHSIGRLIPAILGVF